jgi:3-oxoacyl-[acyl-carrier-protein] synthase-3
VTAAAGDDESFFPFAESPIVSNAYITGLGVSLPNKPVANPQIEAVLGTISDQPSAVKDMILARNGIKWRYYAIDPATRRSTHTNAELTAAAVRHLCETSGLKLDDMDLLACGTSSPDQMIPNHSSMVLGALGARPCEAISTAGVCCAGMSALKYAYLSVLAGPARCAVATGSELSSSALRASQFKQTLSSAEAANPQVNFNQEFLRYMLSDGAGALRITDRPRDDGLSLRIDWFDLVSFSGQAEACMYAGAVKDATGTLRGWRQDDLHLDEALHAGYLNLSQDVDVLFQHIVPLATQALEMSCKMHNLDFATVDYFLPHLSSMFFKQPLSDALDRLGIVIPLQRWFTNLAYKGNTGAASIYIMLEELVSSGKLQPGQRLLCAVPESARFTYALMHLTVS